MASIYEISNWAASIYYSIDDIVKNGNFYYYANQNHTSGGSFDSAKWAGTKVDFDGTTRPEFIWKPSYSSNAGFNPKVINIQFGDGYQQRIKNGINNNLLRLSLVFELKNKNRAKAILHFLDEKAGQKVFLFTPPEPYNLSKRFICQEWEQQFAFKNNNQIRATFIEVPI